MSTVIAIKSLIYNSQLAYSNAERLGKEVLILVKYETLQMCY